MEGIVEELDPDLSIVVVAEPFGRRLMRERLRPRRLWQEFSERSWEFGDVFFWLPGWIDRVLEQVEDGGFTIKLVHAELRETLFRMDRISNRLSFSHCVASFFHCHYRPGGGVRYGYRSRRWFLMGETSFLRNRLCPRHADGGMAAVSHFSLRAVLN